jgi:hypothetical protein
LPRRRKLPSSDLSGGSASIYIQICKEFFKRAERKMPSCLSRRA